MRFKIKKSNMRNSFLLKALVLVVLLAAVLGVIVVAMSGGFGISVVQVGRRPSFFEQFIIAGGAIVWFVLIPMSLITVYLAAEHCLSIRRRKLLPDGIGRSIGGMIRRFGLGQLEAKIAGENDLVSLATARAIAGGRGDWFRMRNLLGESLQDQASKLFRKIEWLNLIGNVSPMVGLFGTVFGMITLFNDIVAAGGDPKMAQLARGISIALVTTFWGLFVAIPALAVHGVFRNRIETLVNDAVTESEILMPEIRRELVRLRQAETQHSVKPILPVRKLSLKSKKTIDEPMPS